MRITFVALFIVLSVSTAFSATIYVPDSYPTIQGALDAAASGDTVIVRPGVYEQYISFPPRDIILRSESGPAETTILGPGTLDRSVVSFDSGASPMTVVEGFTIRNGLMTYGQGGGGGIGCYRSSPTIRNNVIRDNLVQIDNRGGGIHCYMSSPVIENNVIEDNFANGGLGGGIYCEDSSPTITGNTIRRNKADLFGGGIDCHGGSPVITNNIIAGNEQLSHFGGGGGISITSPVAEIIVNNTITLNRAGGCCGGINCGKTTVITNSILRDNQARNYPEVAAGIVRYCNVTGGWPGTGNIDTDPLFVDPASDDFHITWSSPCRDAGYNYSGLPQADFEGDPRIAQGAADMGADEFFRHLYFTGELSPGGSGKIIAIADFPNPCLLALGGLQDPPLPTPYGNLYLKTPLWKQWPFNVTSNGTRVIPVTVPVGASPGDVFHFQVLVGRAGYSSSRLTNLLTLTIE